MENIPNKGRSPEGERSEGGAETMEITTKKYESVAEVIENIKEKGFKVSDDAVAFFEKCGVLDSEKKFTVTAATGEHLLNTILKDASDEDSLEDTLVYAEEQGFGISKQGLPEIIAHLVSEKSDKPGLWQMFVQQDDIAGSSGVTTRTKIDIGENGVRTYNMVTDGLGPQEGKDYFEMSIALADELEKDDDKYIFAREEE